MEKIKEIKLERQSPLPLHIQFENSMTQRIENHEWPVNSNIPSENELCKIYGLSRMTVHAALNRIVEAGLLYRVPGKGTFVAEPKIVSTPPTQIGIREQLEHQGYETSTKLIGVEKITPTTEIIKILHLVPVGPVYLVRRLRSVRGVPLSYHVSYIPARIFPGLEKQDLVNIQMCDIMEKNYHCEIHRRVETLEAITASAEEAQLLEVKPSFPLLLLKNTVYNAFAQPIEFSKVVFRGDKIKLKLEFNKDSPTA